MSDVKQAGELVRAVGRDIAVLRGMNDPEFFADEIFGLHTQQASEKLLKDWLALLDEMYPLTHSLELLLSILQERDAAIVEWKQFVEYTPYAGRIRYETGDPSGQPINPAVALRRDEALHEQLTRRLPTIGS